MRGHEPIIAMRKRGVKPATVFIDTFEDPAKSWRLWPTVDQSLPQVEVLDADMLSGLDFRFLVGLRVVVTGHDARRVKAICSACMDAGAARVVTAAINDGRAAVFDSADHLTTKPTAATATASREIGPASHALRTSAPMAYPHKERRAMEAIA